MARYEYKLVSDALTTGGTVTDNTNGAEYTTPFAERVCKELRVKMHPRDAAKLLDIPRRLPIRIGLGGIR